MDCTQSLVVSSKYWVVPPIPRNIIHVSPYFTLHNSLHWCNSLPIIIDSRYIVVEYNTTQKTIQHYDDVIMSVMASQITSLASVCSTFIRGTVQRKYQSSASLAFVRGIHRWPVNSPHKGPVTRKMFPFDDVVMKEINLAPCWDLKLTIDTPYVRER